MDTPEYGETDTTVTSGHTSRTADEVTPIGGAAFVVDSDLRILVAEGDARATAGLRPSDLIGRTIFEALDPALALVCEPHYRRALAGEPFAHEHDAHGRSYLSRGVPLRDPSGHGHAALVVLYDVTGRQRAEAALAESDRFRRLVESYAQAVWEADADGVMVADSPSWRAYTGQTFDEWLEYGWLAAVHPDNRAHAERQWREAVASGREVDAQFRLQHVRDGWRWTNVRATPIVATDGSILKWVGMNIDVHDRVLAEEALRASEERHAYLLELSDALRTPADAVAIQEAAARLLGRRLRANRVMYFEVNGSDYHVVRGYTEGAAPLAGDYPAEAFGARLLESYRAGRTAVATDVSSDADLSDAERAAFAAVQIRAYIGVPLVKDGEFVAGLAVHAVGPRQWTPTDVALTEATADRTWAAVARARSEEALRAAHHTFRHLVEQSPFGVYAVDADFRLVQVSAGAQKVFENVRPLIGRDLADVLRILWPEPFATEAIDHFRHTLSTGQPYHAPSTVERRRDSGDVESYDWKIERVMLPDGRLGVVCHFYDLSERQQYEAALRAADRQKDDFIAVLAHELRNPLAPIRASVGILQTLGGANPALVRCRDIIDRQVTHMARLLDDLLDVARLSQGKLTLRREPVRLGDVLDAAIETARPAIEDKRHAFTCDAVDPSIVVDGDNTRLAQVFANLLNNAAKYTHPGGRIHVAVHADAGQVAVTVRDTGVGIAPGMRDRIFDLFTQLGDSRDRTDSGLGIGLGLARRLVEMHGGTIVVDAAEPRGGTAFTVTLALHDAARPCAPDPLAAAAAAPAHPPAGSRRRVLVADDNADAADTLGMLLESHGCEVRCVYNGEAAVREAREFRPELVLLDLGMPGVSGDVACNRIRAEPSGGDMVIVAVTGWGQNDDRRRTAMAGFDHHFVKPVDPDALLKLVRGMGERA